MPPRPLPAWARLHFHLHAASALLAGLALIFFPPPFLLNNPLTSFIATNVFHRALPPPSSIQLSDAENLLAQAHALAGTVIFGFGLAYSLALARGYDEWLYMSIPARLVVGAMGHVVWMVVPERTSPLLFGLCMWDGLWAGVLAVAVGSVTGEVPRGYYEGKSGKKRGKGE